MCDTTPSAAALIGEPQRAPMSTPACTRHTLKIGSNRMPKR